MWRSAIRENLGVIFAFLILILVRVRRQLLGRLGKIINSLATYIARTSTSTPAFGTSRINPATTLPASLIATTCGATTISVTSGATYDSEEYPNTVLYFRKPFLGTEYFVIQSAYVAAAIRHGAENFENTSFAPRVFRLCRYLSQITSPSAASTSSAATAAAAAAKRLQFAIRELVAGDEDDKNAGLPTGVAGKCDEINSLFPGTRAGSPASVAFTAAHGVYQKFAMEMSVAKSDEENNLRHLYQTSFDDDEDDGEHEKGKEEKRRIRRKIIELPAKAATGSDADAENGCPASARRWETAAVTSTAWLEEMIPALRSCIKEMTVMLEAKANRKNEIDIREYGYKHAVNILGGCVFGKSIEELTGSRCKFYAHFDRLHRMWTRSEKVTTRSLLDNVLGLFDATKPKKTKQQVREVANYFKALVVDSANEKNSAEASLLKSLISKCECAENGLPNDVVDSLNTFVMAFSICIVEVVAGAISVITHELARDAELQEKIRDKDKVKFTLDGLPELKLEFLGQPLSIDTLIRETFKTYPIDPLVQLTCKQVYRVPNTNFKINPTSVVLIPVNVLQTDNNLHPSMDSFNPGVNQEMENEYSFITDSEMQSFFVFVRQFVNVCLKTTLPSIIQMYEFKTDVELNYDYGTSCRFSTLTSTLPLRASRVEKRGKVVVFEESLKAFHASKDVPFLSKIGL